MTWLNTYNVMWEIITIKRLDMTKKSLTAFQRNSFSASVSHRTMSLSTCRGFFRIVIHPPQHFFNFAKTSFKSTTIKFHLATNKIFRDPFNCIRTFLFSLVLSFCFGPQKFLPVEKILRSTIIIKKLEQWKRFVAEFFLFFVMMQFYSQRTSNANKMHFLHVK